MLYTIKPGSPRTVDSCQLSPGPDSPISCPTTQSEIEHPARADEIDETHLPGPRFLDVVNHGEIVVTITSSPNTRRAGPPRSPFSSLEFTKWPD